MANLQGFWSYVHLDDEAEGGRISQLAKDMAAQFEMLTGEPLALFLDVDSIKWGEEWRDKIDSNLESVAFFVPVLTPRYFMSPECRRELQFFARKATQNGLKELVLPLLYVNVPGLRDESSQDELVSLVRSFQWEDWRELRFADVAAGDYRMAVSSLAARLVEVNRQMEVVTLVPVVRPISGGPAGTDDDTPGFLDQIAEAEAALPALTATIEELTQAILLIGKLAGAAGETIRQGDAGGRAFSSRLVVARTFAKELSGPVERVCVWGDAFVSQLNKVDLGFRALIEQAAVEVAQEPGARIAACEYFRIVRTLSSQVHDGLESMQQMVDSTAPVERMARDLRPVIRRLRHGLTTMIEARTVSDEWVQLIERTGIDCDMPAPDTHQ